MKKIPALVAIDRENHTPLQEVNAKVAHLLAEGSLRATRKRDGQACVWMGGDARDINSWMTRRAVVPGKNAPAGFVLAETDAITGKSFGWEPVANSSVVKAMKQALANLDEATIAQLTPGTTLELCGPKLQGNPEHLEAHQLFPHGSEEVAMPTLPELTAGDLFGALVELARDWRAQGMEGVVFWAPATAEEPTHPVMKLRVKDLLPETNHR